MIASRATVATRVSRDFSRPSHSGAPPVTLLARVERDDDEGSSVYFTRPPTFWENFMQMFCCCCSTYAQSQDNISIAPEEDPRTVHVSVFDPSSTFDLPGSSTVIVHAHDDDPIAETFEEVSLDPASLPSHSEDEVGFSRVKM